MVDGGGQGRRESSIGAYLLLAIPLLPLLWGHLAVRGLVAFACFGIGLALIYDGRRTLRGLRPHSGGERPTPVAELQPGLVATVAGVVTSRATVRSLASGEPFACILATMSAETNNIGGLRTVRSVVLGSTLELADDTGTARLELGAMELFARQHRRLRWGPGEVPDDIAAGLSADDLAAVRAIPGWCIYEELVVAPGDEVTVHGFVADVVRTTRPGDGYRTHEVETAAVIRAPVDEPMRLRSGGPRLLEGTRTAGRRVRGFGAALLAWSVAVFFVPSLLG